MHLKTRSDHLLEENRNLHLQEMEVYLQMEPTLVTLASYLLKTSLLRIFLLRPFLSIPKQQKTPI